ncbi:hypothetical protein AVEN_36152-1 [Araneus ventricosus]|uniref:Uncharacterized protein n=1 Tax=Araneus ventricosus TaxID=182803 RepID=A0A4Y2EIZ4_ARAVE|nr:hypothetical protein AVEN_36152-1 [Araneus ventricosus]
MTSKLFTTDEFIEDKTSTLFTTEEFIEDKTSTLFATDEFIEDKLPGANLTDYEEVIPPSFKTQWTPLKNFELIFFCQKKNEKKKKQSVNLIRFIMMYLILTDNKHVGRR